MHWGVFQTYVETSVRLGPTLSTVDTKPSLLVVDCVFPVYGVHSTEGPEQ